MIVEGHKFECLGKIDVQRNVDGTVKVFMPQSRYDNKKNLPLNKYGKGPFCKFKIGKGIKSAGVYFILCEDDIRYIGQTINLEGRWNSNGYGGISPRNCFKNGQETNCRLNNLIYESQISHEELFLWYCSLINEKSKLDEVEHSLISKFQPIWNKARIH